MAFSLFGCRAESCCWCVWLYRWVFNFYVVDWLRGVYMSCPKHQDVLSQFNCWAPSMYLA
jgi:hypothetical protein